jgi:hypothetical protein
MHVILLALLVTLAKYINHEKQFTLPLVFESSILLSGPTCRNTFLETFKPFVATLFSPPHFTACTLENVP